MSSPLASQQPTAHHAQTRGRDATTRHCPVISVSSRRRPRDDAATTQFGASARCSVKCAPFARLDSLPGYREIPTCLRPTGFGKRFLNRLLGRRRIVSDELCHADADHGWFCPVGHVRRKCSVTARGSMLKAQKRLDKRTWTSRMSCRIAVHGSQDLTSCRHVARVVRHTLNPGFKF